MKSRALRIFAASCLVVLGIGILFLIVKTNSAGKRDFIEYWAAGQQLVHGANPYDGAAILPLQHGAGLEGNHPQVSFSPPVAFFLALPLGFVGANTGLVLWLLVLLACLVASIRILWTMHGRPANRLHLLGYCFAPLMECLMAGQLGIFLLMGIVLFLYFYKTHPFLAGAALLPCALKPHLFLPFAVVLLLWVVSRKAYRILAGFSAILLASCALTLIFDHRVWSQYAQMMRTNGALDAWVPTLSSTFRLLVDSHAVWLQFLPEAAGCGWALWYFWTRRTRWDWMDHGLLVLLVSAACTPYAWFTDESMLLPAVMVGVYRADDSGRSLLPFGLFAGAAMMEVLAEVPITSAYYLWTIPAWIAWYLYATGSKEQRHA